MNYSSSPVLRCKLPTYLLLNQNYSKIYFDTIPSPMIQKDKDFLFAKLSTHLLLIQVT